MQLSLPLSPVWQLLPARALAFVAARAIHSMGGALTAFALDVWLYKQTGSYAIFASLAVVSALPGLLLSPVAGVVVDRFARKSVLICCDVAAAVAALIVVVASVWAVLSPFIAGTAIVLLALARTVSWPAAAASLTGFTDTTQRSRINGIVETLDGAVNVLGPVLGAAMLELAGVTGTALLDVASCIGCIAVLALLRFPVGAPTLTGGLQLAGRTPWRRLLDECLLGFRWIAARRDLVRLLLVFASVNLACSVFAVAYTPYVLSFSSAKTLGSCLALGGSGMIAGGLLFTLCGGLKRHETGILLGGLALAVCMVVFGLARSSMPLFLAAFFHGLCIPFINASSQTIWQARVPESLQGRIFSIRKMIAWGLNPLSVLLSIPIMTSLLSPLTAAGYGSFWGNGQTGTLGLLLSLCGAFCLLAVLVLMTASRLQRTGRSA